MADGHKRARMVGEAAQEEENDTPKNKKQRKKGTPCVRDPHVEQQALLVVGDIVKRICTAMANACDECSDDELMTNRLDHGAVKDIGDLHKLIGPLLLQIVDSSPDIAMDAADGSHRWEEIGFGPTMVHNDKNHALLNLVADIVAVAES